jgi:integral membrane protein (TIGR01906 family)
MYDVKTLVQSTYRVQEGAFLYLLLVGTLGFLILGNDFAVRFRKLLLTASLFNITVTGLIGIAALIDFDPLFTMFHEISFSNDFWKLNPADSYLVRMFPQQFWLECVMLIGIATIVESVALILLIGILKSWQRWRRELRDKKAPKFV